MQLFEFWHHLEGYLLEYPRPSERWILRLTFESFAFVLRKGNLGVRMHLGLRPLFCVNLCQQLSTVVSHQQCMIWYLSRDRERERVNMVSTSSVDH